jgi:predicted nucleotide-binding protein
LDPNAVSYDDAAVDNVESNIRETIRDVFGGNSPEFHTHAHFAIWHGGYNMRDPQHGRQLKFAQGKPQAIVKLEGLVARLEELREDAPVAPPPALVTSVVPVGSRRVFIVHGHDEASKETVARFLLKLDLEPVILHEQPNLGATLIEKFETNADVGFAVVLLTPDDTGHPLDRPAEAAPRARQNVIFELGYFIGRLGRARVCALYGHGVSLPSDFGGVAYIPLDDPQGWRLLLAREIKASGLPVDLNAAM